MPRVRPLRHAAPAAVVSVATALVAALLLAVSLVGGASASPARTIASLPVAHGSAPARAQVGGQVGGQHARVTSTSLTDHLLVHPLDLTSTPPVEGVDLPRPVDSDTDPFLSVASGTSAPGSDSRGPPAA